MIVTVAALNRPGGFSTHCAADLRTHSPHLLSGLVSDPLLSPTSVLFDVAFFFAGVRRGPEGGLAAKGRKLR